MSTPTPPPGFSPQEILALQNAPRLSEIEIGGRMHPLGILDEARMKDISDWGQRIVDSQTKGKPLSAEDRDPSRPLQHLLYAGDPDFQWANVRSMVKSEHCATASREFMRQAVVRALDPCSMAGRA